MKFSKIICAMFYALIVLSSAFEEGEEPCPDYQGSPNCENCAGAGCGYVIDEGDCVKDCANVTDFPCFSLNNTSGAVEDVCAAAAEAKNQTGGGAGGGVAPTAAPAPTSSADSFMTSLVQWTVLVAGVGFVAW